MFSLFICNTILNLTRLGINKRENITFKIEELEFLRLKDLVKETDMMRRLVTVIIISTFSVGILLIGNLLLGQQKEVEENAELQEVTNLNTPEAIPEIEDNQLESLPNLETEVSKWNNHVQGQLEREGFTMISSNVEKDESKSNDEITVFSHVFKSSLDTRLEISVDNVSGEIIEKRLIGYEVSGSDRSAIFHAMSIFVSYVDDEVSLEQAGNYLGTIPFSTNEEGLHEVEFNGKRYDYVLDFSEGLNMLVYLLNE